MWPRLAPPHENVKGPTWCETLISYMYIIILVFTDTSPLPLWLWDPSLPPVVWW